MTSDILVAFDGTGCEARDRSNVVRVVEAARDAGHAAFYHPGVGTRWYNTIRGNLLGVGSFARLEDALVQVACVWQPGDRLWSVGFSRGGAAAIGFANLVDAVGICPGLNRSAAREALKVWQSRPGYRASRTARFRADHGIEPESRAVHFVGAFDPVGALGAAVPRGLARMKFGAFVLDVPPRLRHYVALLAIDEHRAKFVPILQDREALDSTAQIWTPGCHGDVGGSKAQPLANYAYHAMVSAMYDAGMADVLLAPCEARAYRDADATTPGGTFRRVMGYANRRPGLGHAAESRSALASLWLSDGRNPDTPSWDSVRGLKEAA